jgi:thioesterase domain-containing protein
MLVPVQTSGDKPPLFFVHGHNGVMSLGSSLAKVLGSEQPIYAIHANGIDGRRPVLDDMGAMISSYADEIRATAPAGPIRIGGMCAGCMIAIGVCRMMRQEGRQTGPVILVDPPPVPAGYDRRKSAVNPGDPRIADRLYQHTRHTILDHLRNPDSSSPFDPFDPEQMHLATLAGVGVLIAFFRYVPTPFTGPAEVVMCANMAPPFFHPQMPWHKLLSGPRVVHVVPGDHRQLFHAGRSSMCRLVKFAIERSYSPEVFPEYRAEVASDDLCMTAHGPA